LSYTFVISLAINSSDQIFAGTFEGGGVFRSTDNGENWTPVINGLTNTYVLGLAINSNDDIFAATYDYVFRSTDNGESWVHLTNGITNPYCWCFVINSLDYIFLGTKVVEFSVLQITEIVGLRLITA
jgi:hypothetical protein